MTGLRRSPITARGLLITRRSDDPRPTNIVFQYNPDEMTRTLQARTVQDRGGSTFGANNEALRLTGAPIEQISLAVEIDVADQLATGDPLATSLGIYPQLSALELLLYPRSATVIANAQLAASGTIELVPPEAPQTLLSWGSQRVLPVRLTQFSITEQAYDPHLNPIRARVSLGLRVLSYSDLTRADPGYHTFLAHQIAKESMAAQAGRSSSTTAATGSTSAPSPGG